MRALQFKRPPEPRHYDTKSFEFGPLKVFYHSTFPLDNLTQDLTWNFYFGRSGQGLEGIIEIQDLGEWDILVYMQDINQKWGRTGLFLATALARVTVKFPYGLVRGAPTVECTLVFPPDPRKGNQTQTIGLQYV